MWGRERFKPRSLNPHTRSLTSLWKKGRVFYGWIMPSAMLIKTSSPMSTHQLSLTVPLPWTQEDFDNMWSWRVVWESAGTSKNIIWWKEKNWRDGIDFGWRCWQKTAGLQCQEPKHTGLGSLRQSSRCGIECSHFWPWPEARRRTSFLELWKVLRNVHVAQSRPEHWDSSSKRKESTFRQFLSAVCLSKRQLTWTSNY